jgi:hypothetical protein
VSDKAIWLDGLVESGGERIRFDKRIELLRMSSVGATPVEVFLTMLFDSRVYDKWSYEQLPMVQRAIGT